MSASGPYSPPRLPAHSSEFVVKLGDSIAGGVGYKDDSYKTDYKSSYTDEKLTPEKRMEILKKLRERRKKMEEEKKKREGK